MLPWIIGGAIAAYAGYQALKPKPKPTATGGKPAVVAPNPSGAAAAPLTFSANAKNLAANAAQTLAGALGRGAASSVQSSVVQGAATPTTSVDPIAAAAAFAANALLHGTATDPGVQSIVKSFQVAAGLTADGKYGPKTQAALQHYIPGAPAAPAVYGGTG